MLQNTSFTAFFKGNRAGRAEVIVSLLAASIYLAYKIYISCV